MTTTNTTNISASTRRAIAKYGIKTCIAAYAEHLEGNGANTIAHTFAILKGNTRAGDAAINAGKQLA